MKKSPKFKRKKKKKKKCYFGYIFGMKYFNNTEINLA